MQHAHDAVEYATHRCGEFPLLLAEQPIANLATWEHMVVLEAIQKPALRGVEGVVLAEEDFEFIVASLERGGCLASEDAVPFSEVVDMVV